MQRYSDYDRAIMVSSSRPFEEEEQQQHQSQTDILPRLGKNSRFHIEGVVVTIKVVD